MSDPCLFAYMHNVAKLSSAKALRWDTSGAKLYLMTTANMNLVDAEGTLVFVRINGTWHCAFGGVLSPKDIRDLTAFVAGEMSDVAFGMPGLKVSR